MIEVNPSKRRSQREVFSSVGEATQSRALVLGGRFGDMGADASGSATRVIGGRRGAAGGSSSDDSSGWEDDSDASVDSGRPMTRRTRAAARRRKARQAKGKGKGKGKSKAKGRGAAAKPKPAGGMASFFGGAGAGAAAVSGTKRRARVPPAKAGGPGASSKRQRTGLSKGATAVAAVGVGVTAPLAAPVRQPKSKLNLVLFEEADVLFPSDRGFARAVANLLKTARCPIILTCNSTCASVVADTPPVCLSLRAGCVALALMS